MGTLANWCWWVQLRGHGSHSELAEVEGSRRFLKVLLAEDNLINMKASAHPPPPKVPVSTPQGLALVPCMSVSVFERLARLLVCLEGSPAIKSCQ